MPYTPTGTLGVDLGRRRVAVDSDTHLYEATEVNRLRAHYPKVRRSLQRKGTKERSLRSLRPHSGAEAKRLLQRLSGREKRHMRAINHRISKQLIVTTQATQRQITLENLTGIRHWNAAMNIAAAGARVTALEDAPSGKGEDALRRHSRASVKAVGDASPAVRYFSPRYDLRTTSLRSSADAVSCNTISPLRRT
jgi:hypothetical protein